MPAVTKARSAAVGGALCCSGTLWCITPWGSQILTYVMHVVCYIRSETEELIFAPFKRVGLQHNWTVIEIIGQ